MKRNFQNYDKNSFPEKLRFEIRKKTRQLSWAKLKFVVIITLVTTCLSLPFIHHYQYRLQLGVLQNRNNSLNQSNADGRNRRNLTIISAYFNLGSFRKGPRSRSSPAVYKKWANSLTRLHNNLAFYTDDISFKKMLLAGRRKLQFGTTVIFKSSAARKKMWAFELKERIKKIYNSTYPKHFPSTVMPEYACVQHAKFEAVNDALNRKLYPSDYYAWVDVGYFRKLAKKQFPFRLQVPDNFDNRRISFTQIREMKKTYSIDKVIRGNKLWVGGGMFIGVERTLKIFYEQYKKAVEIFISMGLMNTDQQIVYAMFTNEGERLIKPLVKVQSYIPPKGHNPWFFLGMQCLRKVTSPSVDSEKS